MGSTLHPMDILQQRAQAHFHKGKYRDSAAMFEQASRTSSDERNRRLLLLDASDAARCSGLLKRAEALVEGAVQDLPSDLWRDEVLAVSAHKRILIQRDRLALSGAMIFPNGRRRLKVVLRPLFIQASKHAIESGRWFDFQHLGMLASDVGLRREDLRPDGGYEPPEAEHGYRHLGYPVAVAMDACDRFRGRSVDAPTIGEIEGLLNLMLRFGCAPQAWKLARAVMFRASSPLHNFKMFGSQLRCCQYTFRRQLGWLIGDLRMVRNRSD
jgi:hypothetical protein